VDDPYLIEPLADSVLHDDSDFVRLEAVRTLGISFGRDAKAVSALEYALVHDLSPQVRANARWESLDENERRAYVAGTLLRDDLSDVERLELLRAGVSGFRGYVDPRAAQALVAISSRARPSTQESTPEESQGRVSAIEIVPLMMELLTDSPSEEIRSGMATALMRHRGEAGVQLALQQAARDDPSAKVREQITFLFRRSGVPLR
jgi:HEAT repeat protein